MRGSQEVKNGNFTGHRNQMSGRQEVTGLLRNMTGRAKPDSYRIPQTKGKESDARDKGHLIWCELFRLEVAV